MTDICILCLELGRSLTYEHVFPEAAGGTISKYILCKSCNDTLGHKIDAPYVNQMPVQFARATHSIQGKTGKVPQPFSGSYLVDGLNSKFKVKLNSDFTPQVISQAPEIKINEAGGVEVSYTCDAINRKKAPKVIRTSLERFFKSEDGVRLGWSPEEIEKNIQEFINRIMLEKPNSEPIQTTLSGKFTVDLKVMFVEHVKVIYELCCVEFGFSFLDSEPGKRLRAFLLTQCAEVLDSWELLDISKHLGIVPYMPIDMEKFIKFLIDDDLHTHHVAIVTRNFAVCSMLGWGAVFYFKDIQLLSFADVAKVYLSSISGGKSGEFTLSELLSR